MTSYMLKKTAVLLLLLGLVSLVVFSVLFVLPGDPAQIILGINASPETLEALRIRLGLDQPVLAQYAQWIGSLLRGTGGRSITYDLPVREADGAAAETLEELVGRDKRQDIRQAKKEETP